MAKERIHGPYKHGNKWRVVEVRGDGERAVVSFESEADAYKYIEAARRVASGRSVGDTVSEYLEHLKAQVVRGRARRESTLKLEAWRLKAMLRLVEGDRPASTVTRPIGKRLLAQRTLEVKPDTLAGELAAASRWGRWCAAQGWITQDPFEGLVAGGERSAGKPQLRVDSARKFLEAALAEGSLVGTAAAMALLMGMRASEVTDLRARDVDDGGRLLWVSKSKTKAGIRRLAVPAILVPRLLELVKGKGPDESLWGDVDRHWLGRHVPRLCELAGVERVTPHGLRGTFATLSVGALPTDHLARTLGQENPAVTRAAYIMPGAEQSADSVRVGTLLGSQFPTPPPDREPKLN